MAKYYPEFSHCALFRLSVNPEPNPKAEIRNPKEIRNSKFETRLAMELGTLNLKRPGLRRISIQYAAPVSPGRLLTPALSHPFAFATLRRDAMGEGGAVTVFEENQAT